MNPTTKVCSKCKIEKDINNFSFQKSHSDNLKSRCRGCIKEDSHLYYSKNKQMANKRSKKYAIDNIEKMREYRKEYYIKNKEHQNELCKKIYNRTKNRVIQNQVTYQKLRRKTDILFKIRHTLSNRINDALKHNRKSQKTLELVGCSVVELKTYLEKQFKLGMTWENHGFYGWHIDHIKPCAAFDLTEIDEQKKCFHYTNLQPLWWQENIKKKDIY